MRRMHRILTLALPLALLTPCASGAPQAGGSQSVSGRLELMISNGDLLGARIYLRDVLKKIPQGKMPSQSLDEFIYSRATSFGLDLLDLWNSTFPRPKSTFEKVLEDADQLLSERRFNRALNAYQGLARQLKAKNPKSPVYPYLIHSMARALYGAGRYKEALIAYSWIGPNYPRLRQALFEKMWTAFRLGRIDFALGAIASQKSPRFSRLLNSESYIVQSYIYRKLCRTKEIKEIAREIAFFRNAIAANDIEAWATTELETSILLKIMKAPVRPGDAGPIASAEREAESREIRAYLERSFNSAKPKILANLRSAEAFLHLGEGGSQTRWLKPVQAIEGRDTLLKMNLEIWPGDPVEEWADEVGAHRYIGESQCAEKSSS